MNTQQMLNQYEEKTGLTKTGHFIYKSTNTLVDVFSGEGWASCSRYRRLRGKWVHLSGPKLSAEVVAGLV